MFIVQTFRSEESHQCESRYGRDGCHGGGKQGYIRRDQEWVQENYGIHVTNLNIAQVKRKYGIIERENYKNLNLRTTDNRDALKKK